MAKPVLKWVGGKTQLLKELQARVPATYNRYFEPFVGGGALFFALQPKVAYLNDANPELINLYRVIRDNVDGLIDLLKGPGFKNDAETFYTIRGAHPERLMDVEIAARTVYLNKTCFNGLYRVNSKGGFNSPFGKYTNPKICDEENLRAVSAALAGAHLWGGDYAKALEDAQAGDFVFCDPPYIPLSPTSSFTAYTPGKFGLTEQTELRDLAKRLKARGVHVLICNSSSPVTWNLYVDNGFKIEEVSARRSINSKGDKRGSVTELLIS